jgi:hypothetical protein
MRRKALPYHRAEGTFDLEVHLGHEIDGPLLVDAKAAAETLNLGIAGTNDRFNRCGEINGRDRINHRLPAS